MKACGITPAPVLFLAFARPDLLAEVIKAASQAGPRDVWVAIDGPREGHPDDVELGGQVREVAEDIEWASNLRIKAEPRNLGLGRGVVSGISWALAHTKELIILEDD